MEVCARIKETSFLHFKGDQGYQKKTICETGEMPERWTRWIQTISIYIAIDQMLSLND